MDRQSIERRDFPIARRGYDIEAVDAHLAKIADEYEALARRGRADTPGALAASAAEQVRMIVEAAEQSAEDIAREAELEARRLRQDAREQAERLRAEAGRQARDHVARVADLARGLLDRVEGMDRELGTLLDTVRGGGQRLAADLSLMQGTVAEVGSPGGAAEVGASGDDAPPPDFAAAAAADPGSGALGDASAADDDSGEEHRPDPSLDAMVDSSDSVEAALPAPGDVGTDADAAADVEGGPRAVDAEGARMLALHMALNGVERAETRAHLERNFSVEGLDDLLDDVYARAGR